MQKTLISFIGTGRPSDNREYRKATYSFRGHTQESSFVSAVLADVLNVDKLYLLGTVKSMWEEVYRFFCHKNNMDFDEEYWTELGSISDNANHKTDGNVFDFSKLEKVLGEGSKVVILPYGLDDAEHWTIFAALENLLSQSTEQEEIFLDITHSFRSMPLFSMTSIMYIQDVLGTHLQVKGIFYGMLEVMGEFSGIAPIVDLSIIIEIQNWIKAAHSFLNYGKGYLLADLLDDDVDAKLVRQLSDAMALNYLFEVDESLANLEEIAKKEYSGIAKHILPKVLNDLVNRMNRAKKQNKFSHAYFQLELADWHYKNKNYALSYLVFVESIITFGCELKNYDWKEQTYREQVKRQIKRKNGELGTMYREVNKIRNKIAHDIRKGGKKSFTVIEDLKGYLTQFKKILNQEKCS